MEEKQSRCSLDTPHAISTRKLFVSSIRINICNNNFYSAARNRYSVHSKEHGGAVKGIGWRNEASSEKQLIGILCREALTGNAFNNYYFTSFQNRGRSHWKRSWLRTLHSQIVQCVFCNQWFDRPRHEVPGHDCSGEPAGRYKVLLATTRHSSVRGLDPSCRLLGTLCVCVGGRKG